uniref:Uncharacterized protein n=1 Tax=Cannabis sativa TaxID=3483 RepID=A0A803QDF0_CANSA
MQNVCSMSISPEAIHIPTSVSPVESEVVTCPAEEVFSNAHPCLAIVPYQSMIDDSPWSSSLPPVSQKPRTFQGKALTLSKKASTLSSLTQPVSKRVTHSSSSSKSPMSPVQPTSLPKSKLIGPPRSPSKSKTKSIPVPSTDSSPKHSSKASVYQRWFGSCELWFEQLVVLDDFPELHAFLQIRKWVHTISKLSASHPILIREFYANLDRTVIAEGQPGCASAFVRGTRIPFGPSNIACILKLSLSKIQHMGNRILEASETTGTRNKLPFPSLIQKVLMTAHPPLTTHDYQISNPILMPQNPPAAAEPSPASTAPHSVSSVPLSQGEFDKDVVQSAHVQ